MEITQSHGHAAAVHAAHAAARAQAAPPTPQAHLDPSTSHDAHGPAVVLGGALAIAASQGAGASAHPAATASYGRSGTAGLVV